MHEINIESLSIDDRHKLVDLIEGMPQKLNKFVKISINEKFLNPALYKGRERKIHPFSTIYKYLNKKDIMEESNPMFSYYQSQYCVMVNEIDKISHKGIKARLLNIANAESYDEESMTNIEISINELIDDYKKTVDMSDIVGFISINILPYKLQVYDFYSYLTLKDVLNITSGNSDHMYSLNCSINKLIEIGETTIDSINLSVLIYLYMKEIGCENMLFGNHRFIERYEYLMKHFLKTDEFIEDTKSHLRDLVNNKKTTTEVISDMINIEKYGVNISITLSDPYEFNEDFTSKSMEYNGMVYLFKHPHIFEDDIEMITNNIRILISTEFKQYLDEGFNPDCILFDLNDNDCGHLLSNKDIEFGTAYNSFNREMYYICQYDGIFYLLFKSRSKNNTIFGMSLNKFENNDRKIIEIKESKAFYYKFIPNI